MTETDNDPILFTVGNRRIEIDRPDDLFDSGGNEAATHDGTRIANPNDLQATLDAAATDGEFGTEPSPVVKLVSGTVYTVDAPVTLHGVTLDCNGALVVPGANVNIFELHRGAVLLNAHVNCRPFPQWDAVAVVVGASPSGKVEVANRAWVRDCYLLGKSGIGLQFRGGAQPCSMQRATGTIDGFDVAIDCYAAGPATDALGDWSNGNHFEGEIRGYRIGVRMRSKGAAVSGNTFRLQAQPKRGRSEWLWYFEDDPRTERGDNSFVMGGNHMTVLPWDSQAYDNEFCAEGDYRAPLWYLGRGKRYGNALVDQHGRLGNEYLLNRSDQPERNGIRVDHAGPVEGTRTYRPSGDGFHPASRSPARS